MKVVPSSFDAVFDGTANFVPRAILDLDSADMPGVRALLQNHTVRGEDGLDDYDAVPMILHMDEGTIQRFALWRHAHNPKGHIAIQLPIGDDFGTILEVIFRALRIPTAAIVWRDDSVTSGERDAVGTGAPRRRRQSDVRPMSRAEFGRRLRTELAKFQRMPGDAQIDSEYSAYRGITDTLGIGGNLSSMLDQTGEVVLLVDPRFPSSPDRQRH